MYESNSARDNDYDDDYNREGTKVRNPALRPYANVPPEIKVMGLDQNALPVPLPTYRQPYPDEVPPPSRRPTGYVPAAPHEREERATGYRPAATDPRRQPPVTAPTLRPQTAPRRPIRTGLLPGSLTQSRLKLVLLGLGIILASGLAYLLISTGLHAWQTWQDDLTYGRPRTMQLDQFVGHNEQDGTPSHFIAQNNNRQITVLEYPGGDVSKTRVFQGPRLFGKDTELLPVRIRFEDLNGDNNVDLLLSVDNQLIIYINQDGTFRPITSEEKAKLKLKN
ncbi:MAG: hypothetical protein WCS37_19580 [Chloroflexota bacterium]|nr:hypothetical protein [Chloroflexota bacterium]